MMINLPLDASPSSLSESPSSELSVVRSEPLPPFSSLRCLRADIMASSTTQHGFAFPNLSTYYFIEACLRWI